MECHENGDVERADPDGEDFGGDEVRDGEPPDGPRDGVEVDGGDTGFSRCRQAGARFDLSGRLAVCGAEVGAYEGQRGDLEGDAEHERATAADKVDDEDGEDERGGKLHNGVEARGEEARFFALDAQVAEDGR